MRPSVSAVVGALLAISGTACTVARGGLNVGDVDSALPDGGPADLGLDTDAPEVDFGSADSGTIDLSRDDLGCEDLGAEDLGGEPCRDLGFQNHRSCRELRDDSCIAPLASGYFEIDVDGAGVGPPVEVYCDMLIAGGGWTLVGRSDNTGDLFGWGTRFGSVHTDSEPYSLGLGGALMFDEVLVGRRAGGKDWGTNPVYRFTVTANFVNAYAASAYAIPAITTERGGCTPSGGSSMLRYTGYTNEDHRFFFRDSTVFDSTDGLRADGFALLSGGCDVSGGLDGQNGMIMVR